MTTSISSKGQIVLPIEIRRRDGIEPGQEFEIKRLNRGDYRLVRRKKKKPANKGLMEWLLSCPEKGFLVPFVSDETTEDL